MVLSSWPTRAQSGGASMDHNDTQHSSSPDDTGRLADPARVSAVSLPSLSAPAWLLLGGIALALVGMLFPWEHDTALGRTVATQGPMDVPAGAVLLFALVAALGWVVWPIRVAPLSKQRLIGA